MALTGAGVLERPLVLREIPKVGRTLPGSVAQPVLKGGALPGSRPTAPRAPKRKAKRKGTGIPVGVAGKKKAKSGGVVASRSRSTKSKAPAKSPAKRSGTTAAERITTSVLKGATTAAINRTLGTGRGRASAAKTRALVSKLKAGTVAAAKKIAPHAKTAAKVAGVAAAGAAAYGITRASPLGGKLGDAIVKRIYDKRDKTKDARLKAFRTAVAVERAKGPVSSTRVKELAKQFGPF